MDDANNGSGQLQQMMPMTMMMTMTINQAPVA